MPIRENLLHQKFGQLTAIGIAGRDVHKKILWLWRCDCGTYKVLPAQKLKSDGTKSCGCSRHTPLHGMCETPTYTTWRDMKSRCDSPNNTKYANYGQCGVSVCERWYKFENFCADMGERPHGTTIERIDNSKGYSPDNCKWASQSEQMRNTRRNVWLTLNDETMCLTDWATRMKLSKGCLAYRKAQGWSDEKILTTPSLNIKRRVEI